MKQMLIKYSNQFLQALIAYNTLRKLLETLPAMPSVVIIAPTFQKCIKTLIAWLKNVDAVWVMCVNIYKQILLSLLCSGKKALKLIEASSQCDMLFMRCVSILRTTKLKCVSSCLIA